MIAFVDVQYAADHAIAGCVLSRGWSDAVAEREWTVRVAPIAPYEPGQFFKRELPCLLAVLERAPRLEAIVIDGYVWLDEARTPGLGAHLFSALSGVTPVIGVAKTAFKGSPMAVALPRPGSTKPLFVTSAGIEQPRAAELIGALHGAFRIPTMIARVDRLARGHSTP